MPLKIEGESLYSIQEASEFLKMGREGVRNYIQDGSIKAVRSGNLVYIPETNLSKFKVSAIYARSPLQRLRGAFKAAEQRMISLKD